MLMDVTDYIGLPLDGWSNDSVLLFRTGRSFLYDETVSLLTLIDEFYRTPNVVINTVMHKGNFNGLSKILNELAQHRSICHWNIFQYTPTDQVDDQINLRYHIDAETFESTCNILRTEAGAVQWAGECPTIEFRSIRSRLGEYLLINSDGNAWLPDPAGNTVYLGNVYGCEAQILEDWSIQAMQIKAMQQK
jgi:MoaA/NifB/PqqE/SkfB family radical SAM enzyme